MYETEKFEGHEAVKLVTDKISKAQENYYNTLLKAHGPSVDAVASGKQIYKELRYEKLCKIFERDTELTLHDVGCGLCHLLEYIKKTYPDKSVRYSGSEITSAFVDYCRKNYPANQFYHRDLAEKAFDDKHDYLVFGGAFYHLIGTTADEFNRYVKGMLENAFTMCNRGMAFNFITDYVEYRCEGLFYAKVPDIIDFVANRMSRFFSIDHAYPLYEYTVHVYKEAYIASHYRDESFHKYFKITAWD